jgi:adenylate kinase family enzyme
MNSHIIHIHGPQASGKTTLAALIGSDEATWLASLTATWDIWRTIHDIDNSQEYTIIIDDLLIEEDILNPLFIHLNSPVVRDAYRVILLSKHPLPAEYARHCYCWEIEKTSEGMLKESNLTCAICGSDESFGLVKVDGEEEYHCWPDCKEQ